MEQTTEIGKVQQYLTFLLAHDEYAIELLRAREIIEYGAVTHVPGMPACFRGVINLRGSVLPVVDLAVKFGLTVSEPTKQTCIVVVEASLDHRPTALGVLADEVNQVIELGDRQIQPPPAFGTRIRADYLRGLGEVESGFVLLLDIDRILTVDELLAASTPEAFADAAPEGGSGMECGSS